MSAAAKLGSSSTGTGNPRTVAFISELFYVEGAGYRVSLVVEGEDGHHPTGTWPYSGAHGETRPWFWGHDLARAQERARAFNEGHGISALDADLIVARSMSAGHRRGKRPAQTRGSR